MTRPSVRWSSKGRLTPFFPFAMASIIFHAMAVGWTTDLWGFANRSKEAPPRNGGDELFGERFDAIDVADEVPVSAASLARPSSADDHPYHPREGSERPRRPLSSKNSVASPRQGDANESRRETVASDHFGAVGDRAAVNIALAFTRGFSLVASADHAWVDAPIGSAGDAEVRFVLSESGTLLSTTIAGRPSSALRSGITKTLALLRSRTFTARSAVTTLSLRSDIRTDTTHDGLHGDVFAVGATFSDKRGSAFFALSIGRRIDLVVREK